MLTQDGIYQLLVDRYGKSHRVSVTHSLCNGKDYAPPNNVPDDYICISIGDCTTYYVYLYWKDYYPSVELLYAEIDKQLLWWADRLNDNNLVTKEQRIASIASELLAKLMKGK